MYVRETASVKIAARPPAHRRGFAAAHWRSRIGALGTAAWRNLRSRNLAIALLVALTMLSALGALLPQQDRVGPVAYAQWVRANPSIAWLARLVSLDSLYSSWWFLALFAMLYLNTLACTLPQFRAAYRRTSRLPELSLPALFPANAEFPLASTTAEALDTAALVLRRRGLKVETRSDGVAASKGSLAPWGSPLFHLGLVVLMTGAALGGLFRFTGYVEVGEGQAFVDAAPSYLQRSQGPLFDRSLPFGQGLLPGLGHQGFTIQLDRFTATRSTWREGTPADLASEVTIVDRGGAVSRTSVSINQPADQDGLRIYQTANSGVAPVFLLELPSGERQMGMVYLSSTGDGHYENSLNLPGGSYKMTVKARDGDSAVDIDVFERKLHVVSGHLEPGRSLRIDDATLTVQEVRRWTGLRVVNEAGDIVMYAGFALVAIGLLLIFLLVHRQVWATVADGPEGPVLRLWGRAPRLRALFAIEMEEISRDLEVSLGVASK
ncbi:MAG TPA: cytochrome c biogenesis protein ResB [Chloroflexota bacterium]